MSSENEDCGEVISDENSWNGFSDPIELNLPEEKPTKKTRDEEIEEIDEDIQRTRKCIEELQAQMEEDDRRRKQRDLELNAIIAGTPNFPPSSPIAPQTPDHPPTPLAMRSKDKPKRTREEEVETADHEEREGTPSKRLHITESWLETMLEESETLEDCLSRREKAQGLRASNIIEQRTRRGK